MKRSSSILVLLLLVMLPVSLMAAKKHDQLPEKSSKSTAISKVERKEVVEEKTSETLTTQTTTVKNKKESTSAIDITPVEIIDNNINTPVVKAPQAGETIGWQVLSGGATDAISTSYHLQGTLGQVAVGLVLSPSYTISQGYWQDFGSGPTACCGQFVSGFTGNTTCDIEGKRNLADITSLIDHVYISKDDLCCNENGNVNGDPEGKSNLADITSLIDHVYIGKEQTAACL